MFVEWDSRPRSIPHRHLDLASPLSDTYKARNEAFASHSSFTTTFPIISISKIHHFKPNMKLQLFTLSALTALTAANPIVDIHVHETSLSALAEQPGEYDLYLRKHYHEVSAQ